LAALILQKALMSKKIYIELDARYKGYPSWKYFVPRPNRISLMGTMTRYDSTQLFHSWREWCWQTWGASKELQDWHDDLTTRPNSNMVSHSENWCWINDSTSTRIYLRGDAELVLFLLRWA
jgi:hypothetical protein